jgi:biopolymer transport protein ExbD
MKVRRTGGGSGLPEKIEIPMTPMIDMVFQLLVFFIMNFKVVDQEGDFNIKMPLAGSAVISQPENLFGEMVLTLSANGDGDLAGIVLNVGGIDTEYSSLKEVRDFIISNVPTTPGADDQAPQVELNCAPNLKYSHTVDAITAVSGWINERGEVVPLVEKIKFRPPPD